MGKSLRTWSLSLEICQVLTSRCEQLIAAQYALSSMLESVCAPATRGITTSASSQMPRSNDRLRPRPSRSKLFNRDTYQRGQASRWDPQAAPLLLLPPNASSSDQGMAVAQPSNALLLQQPRTSALPTLIPAKQLTHHMMQTESLRELRGIVLDYSRAFDHIAVAAAVTRVAQLLQKSTKRNAVSDRGMAERLLDRLLPALEQHLALLQGRELCNCLWAMAKVNYEPGQLLLDRMITELLQPQKPQPDQATASSNSSSSSSSSTNSSSKLESCSLLELAMLATAAAKLCRGDHRLWSALTDVATAALTANVQGNSSSNGSRGRAGFSMQDSNTGGAADGGDSNISSGTVSQLLSAYARARHLDRPLLAAAGAWVAANATAMPSRDLAGVVWACAHLRYSHHAMLEAVAAAAASKPWDFDDTDLSMLAWGLGKLQYQHSGLMTALANRVERGHKYLPPSTLAQVLWAYARMGERSHTQMVKAVCSALAVNLDQWTSKDLSQALPSAARLGFSDAAWWQGIGRAVAARIGRMQPQHIANMMQAFATVGVLQPELAREVAVAAIGRAGEFNGKDVWGVVCGFADVGFTEGAAAAKALLGQLSSVDVGKLSRSQVSRLQQAVEGLGIEGVEVLQQH